ncbi:hypothetical protein TNCV_4572261 [Trichonephila clavipes]|nr:hypothetical protein TNCV_4572261 [Trichonephila clavipes]
MASLHPSAVQPFTYCENCHAYAFFCGKGSCAILVVGALHLVALKHTNFYAVLSIAKQPTGLPKMMPTCFYGQHFAMFPLIRHCNVRNGVVREYYTFNIK